MHPSRLVRRGTLALTGLAVLAAGAAPARTDRTAEDLGEVWTSPHLRRAWRVRRDPATGEKWLEASDGERAASVEAVVLAEEAALPDLERRVARELLARMRDPAQDEAPVLVVFRMTRQQTTEAAEAAGLRHDARIDELTRGIRTIVARLAARRPRGEPVEPREEERLLAAGEREELTRLRTEARELVRRRRRETLDEAKPAALADQEALVADLAATAGARVVTRSFVLSCVTAVVPVGALRALVEAHTEVAHVAPSLALRPTLDVSVPVVGASSFWNAGYDGSSSGTKVAILDTGCDSSHPALSNVTDEAVFLSAASQDSNFADDVSSTDDFYGHGTHVAGIAGSVDSTYAGVAPGASLMNAKCGYLWQDSSGYSSASLQDADILDAGDWAADNGADVLNCSFGGSATTNGSSGLTLFFDAIVHDLGIAVAVAAGNSGSSSNTVGAPADGFNVVSVGNWDDNGTSSTSDDSIANSSSRGPLDDGRRKPDLAAPGTNIASCDATYDTNGGSYWITYTGTSMASPHVAGALALLTDAGTASRPEGMKALLLTNANNASPFPSSPGNTWGYGAMDLSATYTNRASVCESSLTSNGPRYVLLAGSALGSSQRVTLTWNRRVMSRNDAVPNTYSSQIDLDLYVYDQSDGASRGTSTSGLESVEQVKTSSSANSPVVKVYRSSSSFPSGLSTQRFAVAIEASGGISEATGPSLVSSFTALPSQIAGATNFTVTAGVSNAGDVAAISPSVTLTLPSGYSIVSGSNPATLSTIAAGSATSASWTVRSPSTGSGSKTFSASARTTSYGESFNGAAKTAAQTLDVDAPTNPSVTLASGAAYATSSTVTATLSASDSGTGVKQMRTRTKGDSWGPWVAYAASATVTLTGGDGARTLEAEFQDAVGNVSATASDAIVVDSVAPTGTVTVAAGAAWTTTAATTLTLAASDATSGVGEMRFSHDGTTWTAWAPYATTAAWTLAGSDGAKTVHAQFRDAAGNVSAVVTDGIGLDRVAPSGTLTIDDGNAWAARAAVTLGLAASDATAGVQSMRFSDDGVVWSSWATYAATSSWTLPGSDGTKTVHAQVRDAAGNVSSTATDSIGLDRSLPSGTVTIAGGAAWTGTRDVSLDVAWTDGGSSVAEMRFSDDGATWSSWTAVAKSASWTLPAGDGAKSVHAQFRDVAGNASPTASDAIGLDRTGPAGSLTVAGGASWATALGVALSPGASDPLSGVQSMRFSDDGVAWSAWMPYAASASWTLPAGDGAKTVYAQYRDAVGNVSPTATDAIGLDRTAPSGAVTIAGGSAWTATTAVSLGVSAGDATSGVASMRFSADGTNWTSWTAFAASAAWTLPDGDGTKAVHVQFEDFAGNVSAASADEIGLDRTAPSVSLVAADGAAWVRDAAVSLAPGAGDATSGVAEMRFSDDASTWSPWAPYAESAAWTLPGRDGRKWVFAQVRDTAGNVSDVAQDDLGLDTEPPAGSVAIEGGAVATNRAPVALSMSWADAVSGVTEMRLSDDGAEWSPWTPAKFHATRILPFGEGPHAVHVEFRDAAGNVSSSATDSVVVDTVPPSGTFALGGGADYLPPGAPLTATFAAADGAGSGVSKFRWSHDRGRTWSDWVSAEAPVDIGLPADVDDARHTVLGAFADLAGNSSAVTTASIHLLAAAPQDADAARTIEGRLGAPDDVDAYRVRLAAGDRFDASVALRLPRGASLTAGLDLYDPSGVRVASHASNARGVGARIRRFKAPETGTYVLVLHPVAGVAEDVPYRLATSAHLGRTKVSGRAAAAEEISFDGVEGRVVAGSLRGLRLASVVLQGPEDEPVGLTLRGAPGRALTLPPQTLSFGSGPYVLRVAPAERGKVSWALRIALPRRARSANESAAQ